MKDSIQDRHFLWTGSPVVTFVLFEPTLIGLAIVTFIPPRLAIIWYRHSPPMEERNLLHEQSLQDRYHFVLDLLWIHKRQRIVVLHHQNRRALSPDAEHRPVYDIRETTLRVICNRFPEGSWIIPSAKEPSSASSKRCKIPDCSELGVNVTVPSNMRRECGKVFGLKVPNHSLR